MGLDAFVCCDCYEKGQLHELPPRPEYVRMSKNGQLFCENPDFEQAKHVSWADPRWQAAVEKDIEFDRWLAERACSHQDGILVHHWIGNLGLVVSLRQELKRQAQRFPILLNKVLYSALHTGDYLTVDTVNQLGQELELLATFQCVDPDIDSYMHDFYQKMVELREAALSVSKPIAF
jgi:hypothetical protein